MMIARILTFDPGRECDGRRGDIFGGDIGPVQIKVAGVCELGRPGNDTFCFDRDLADDNTVMAFAGLIRKAGTT